MIPSLRGSWLGPDRGRPLLVVGPSLGTAVRPLWGVCADQVSTRAEVDVLGWELPGHGDGPPVRQAFTLAELAAGVVELVDRHRPGARFVHAGVSVAGCTGLELALGESSGRLRGTAVICSGPRLGTPQGWVERAELVGRSGTVAMVEGSSRRWFAAGFAEREPAVAAALLASLERADDASYALVCEALADFDAWDGLQDITVPTLLLGGVEDQVAPPQLQEEMSAQVAGSSLTLLEGVGHLAPAEAPGLVADALGTWLS